ncbi:uncharacterized protein LOC124925227 [Impatiens glandulifera]|uniref:uncharacterized protein LOC124925227 n=1 Tax=Impatiens glandulifera TaxID=253017 RepID=UPI001FB112A4|nr:uncharacterized protein LOC124925227 [Impatiens glandulifera]
MKFECSSAVIISLNTPAFSVLLKAQDFEHYACYRNTVIRINLDFMAAMETAGQRRRLNLYSFIVAAVVSVAVVVSVASVVATFAERRSIKSIFISKHPNSVLIVDKVDGMSANLQGSSRRELS